jgi:hypothetical protein
MLKLSTVSAKGLPTSDFLFHKPILEKTWRLKDSGFV